MKSTLFLALALSAIATAAGAQDISGRAKAIDGDSLDLSGIIVRLHGIDAVEARQSCGREESIWACGKDAAAKLGSLVRGGDIECRQRDMDRYGRIVATCHVGGTDLAGAMVAAGLAVALPEYSDSYVAAEARARAQRVGIWASDFQRPSDYRAANPSEHRRSPAGPSVSRRGATSAPPPEPYYRNCKDARAAGAAPLYRGKPGYRPEMDGDGDGIACEPWRGR
jgi:endonuclease YncB( thermonuclease family)